MFTYALIHMQVYTYTYIDHTCIHKYITHAVQRVLRGTSEKLLPAHHWQTTPENSSTNPSTPANAKQYEHYSQKSVRMGCDHCYVRITRFAYVQKMFAYLLWCVVNVSQTDTRTFTGIPLMPRWSISSLTCNQPHTPCVSLVPTHLCPHIESTRNVHVQVHADLYWVISPHIVHHILG